LSPLVLVSTPTFAAFATVIKPVRSGWVKPDDLVPFWLEFLNVVIAVFRTFTALSSAACVVDVRALAAVVIAVLRVSLTV